MKILEADCVLVANWVKISVWKWVFTKALSWAPYCSSWFCKPSHKSFVQDVPEKTCTQMTWSSSLNRWRNCRRSWSSGRLTWKERDFGSTSAKLRSWYLGQGSMCFRNTTKTAVPCVSRVSAQTPFSVVVGLWPLRRQAAGSHELLILPLISLCGDTLSYKMWSTKLWIVMEPVPINMIMSWLWIISWGYLDITWCLVDYLRSHPLSSLC